MSETPSTSAVEPSFPIEEEIIHVTAKQYRIDADRLKTGLQRSDAETPKEVEHDGDLGKSEATQLS